MAEEGLVVRSVLWGNRSLEGRVHPEVRANYLASPPLVVAFALAGRVDFDFDTEPLGTGTDGVPVFLRDIWPTQAEVQDAIRRSVQPEAFVRIYADAFKGDAKWQALNLPTGDRYAWQEGSTYVKHPPYFIDMPAVPGPPGDMQDAPGL